MILTATSGDTGKAALAGFADAGHEDHCLLSEERRQPHPGEADGDPEGGQHLCCGHPWQFDDAQSGVKAIFSDRALEARMAEAGFQFSSANSINIGRLVPQVVYYVYAYVKLLENGELSGRGAAERGRTHR